MSKKRHKPKYSRSVISNVVGTVDMAKNGTAYIVVDSLRANTLTSQTKKDIFVRPNNIHDALHGDKVEVKVKAAKGKHNEGIIIRILKRARESFVGVLQIEKKYATLSVDQRLTGGRDFIIPLDKLNGGTDQTKCVAKIEKFKDNKIIGEVVAVLGNVGDNDTEMHAILAEFGLPYSYPQNLEQLADNIPPGIEDELPHRLDFRDVTTFTIDPVDAKDFDDTLSIRKVKDGVWEVGVHIADVTHYVKEGDLIDQEGFNRATSVYLVDRTIPMLPERLSNFICSLRPDEEKLTYSVIFEMNDDAEILTKKISRTVIKSNRRFTYEEVQAIIEGADGDYKPEILKLNDLAKILRKKRFEHGAVSFDRVEVRFNIDEKGKPLSVYFKEAKESNNLVEEFMLLANRTVAEKIGDVPPKNKRTFVYRVHDKPNEEKYNKFTTFVRKFGYDAEPQKGEGINSAVNRILAQVKGKGEENLVSTLAIRTMAKAIYTTQNIGHYGLAFDFYTHFTSPIRRYPDCMVHRLLTAYLNDENSRNAHAFEDFCKHCSEMEQLAADAERQSIKYKQVEFMADKIGQEFDAVVSGVTAYGLFCEIVENKCEGMIPIYEIPDDHYSFDEDNFRLIGKTTGRRIQLGDPIKIKIARADLEKKQLDFIMA